MEMELYDCGAEGSAVRLDVGTIVNLVREIDVEKRT